MGKGKKGFWEFLILAGICMFVAGLFIRDGRGQNESAGLSAWREGNENQEGLWGKNTDQDQEPEEKTEGILQIAGSTSMEKVTWALAESFMEEYPGVTVTVECVGSSAGIEAVAEGRAQVGNASRTLKEEERKMGLVETFLATDGIVVCVDSSNQVQNLTKKELADIYTGRIVNWQQVGGEDIPIVVIGREAGSGTRDAFETYLGLAGQCRHANELDSAGAVLARIATTAGAIGYLSMAEADERVKCLWLDGVEPCVEQVAEGRYPLSRPFVMVTGREGTGQDLLVDTWLTFVQGRKGQKIMAQIGLAGP